MNFRSRLALVAIALAAVPACDDHNPSAPSPTPTPDLSRLLGLWNLTVSLSAVSNGGGCVGDTMQSQVGVPKSYSLLIAPNDLSDKEVNVTLTSASGDYACTFTGGSADSSGFTFGPTGGRVSCERGDWIREFQCANGMRREIFAFGQNLSGRVSGSEISGTWDVSWDIMHNPDPDTFDVDTRARYTGSR